LTRLSPPSQYKPSTAIVWITVSVCVFVCTGTALPYLVGIHPHDALVQLAQLTGCCAGASLAALLAAYALHRLLR